VYSESETVEELQATLTQTQFIEDLLHNSYARIS
jgi:hypothetical protein